MKKTIPSLLALLVCFSMLVGCTTQSNNPLESFKPSAETAEATENANNLKETNNLLNLENINGDCAKVIPSLVKSLSQENVIVTLDPPRKGCDEKLLSLLKTNVYFQSRQKPPIFISYYFTLLFSTCQLSD